MTDENNAFAKVIAKAWGDEAFRAQLLADPTAALAAEGVTAPEGTTFAVVEDTADVVHVVLPARPTELSDAELDSVAAGFSTAGLCTHMCGKG